MIVYTNIHQSIYQIKRHPQPFLIQSNDSEFIRFIQIPWLFFVCGYRCNFLADINWSNWQSVRHPKMGVCISLRESLVLRRFPSPDLSIFRNSRISGLAHDRFLMKMGVDSIDWNWFEKNWNYRRGYKFPRQSRHSPNCREKGNTFVFAFPN